MKWLVAFIYTKPVHYATARVLTNRSGHFGDWPETIRQYARRWARARAAGRELAHHAHAWDTSSLYNCNRHTLIHLRLMRHVSHREVWAAFAHHSWLLSVVIHVH